MRRAFCLFTIFFLLSSLFSIYAENILLENFDGNNIQVEKAAKKEKKSKSKKQSANVEEPAENAPVTKISVDKDKKKKNSGYFSGIEENVLALVEDGSAESLVEAASKLRKSSTDYEENEKVLINIIAEILRVVWPSQNVKIDTHQVSARNAYTGAIESLRNGIYDTSTGKGDFLACVLPALVLCSATSRSDYYEQAEKDLRAALALNSKSVLANYLLGYLFYKMENNEDAATYLKIAAEKSDAFEISFNLASVLNALGRYGESQAITDRLLVRYPSNLNLLKLLAQNAYDRNDYSSAERYAMLVLTQNPADLDMVLFRAKVFVNTGEYLKAASLLDVYAKSNATAKDYLVLRARVQKEWNKNISAAIATIEKALSLYPNDGDVILCAAELAGESGRTVGGRTGAQLSEQILSKDPENPSALAFLIHTLVDEEKWNQAYNASKKLMAKKATIDIVSLHVKICLELRLNDEAWNNAASLYEKSSSEEKAIQTYVEAMVRTGRTVQASRYINSAINNASSTMKSFLYYQRSFLAAGETAQLADLRSAVIANPRNSDALFRMYRIYFQKQDYRKAQYYLRQVIALNPNKASYLRLNSELDKLIK